MYSDLVTVVALAFYLPAVLFLHAAWYRMNPGLKNSPAQGPAIKVVAFGALCILVTLAVALPQDAEWLSHLLFACVGLASLATFYFSFLCVSESGRRYFLLTLLARNGQPLSREELAALYGKDYMIDVRLGRMITWGVIEETGGRLFLRKQSFYIYSAFFHTWAKLLGYRWFERTNSI
jgi:hypothetical protein